VRRAVARIAVRNGGELRAAGATREIRLPLMREEIE
jgi:hypothetical protein